MTHEIKLPRLEKNMDAAIIQKWYIEEGQIVYKGDALAEIFTDEGNRDVIAEETGILTKQIGKIDEEYPVETVIGYLEELLEDSEASETMDTPKEPEAESDRVLAEPDEAAEKQAEVDPEAEILQEVQETAVPETEKEPDHLEFPETAGGKLEDQLVAAIAALEKNLEETLKEGERQNVLGNLEEIRKEAQVKKEPVAEAQPEGDPREGKQRATPAARRIAREYQVELKDVEGTGPRGRIGADDVKKTLIRIPGKSAFPSHDPVVIGSRLEIIPGNPENTFVAPEKLETVPGKKLLKTMNQRKEKVFNPDLDFVPFVDENYVSVIPEEKVKISELDFLPFVDPPEVSTVPEDEVNTKTSELDFVPFVDFKAQPLREEIIVKPTPIHELDKKEEMEEKELEVKPIEVVTEAVEAVETVEVVEAVVELDVEKQTAEIAEVVQVVEVLPFADLEEPTPQTEVDEIRVRVDEEPASDPVVELTVSDQELSEEALQMGIQEQPTVITLSIEIDMSEVKELRKKISHKIEDEIKYRVAYTDFLLLAATRALIKHPVINSWLEGSEIITHSHVNIGLSVEGDEGFVIPVIRNAHEMTLVEMVKSRGNLLKSIKNKSYTEDDLQGSTFTITNLGMYGISQFTASIQKPNAAILSVGEVVQRMRIHQGKPVIRSVMNISLNLDQRAADSLAGAKFLQDLKADMENPPLLLF